MLTFLIAMLLTYIAAGPSKVIEILSIAALAYYTIGLFKGNVFTNEYFMHIACIYMISSTINSSKLLEKVDGIEEKTNRYISESCLLLKDIKENTRNK